MENGSSLGEGIWPNRSLTLNLSANVTSANDVVFKEYRTFMTCISYFLLCIAAFGLPGNILVIITYAKIGFLKSINISYGALAIADIIGILFIIWNGICFLPQFNQSDLPFVPTELVVVTAGAMGECFGAITAWITTFISFERCLCVVRPLKIKRIITRRRTIVTVTLIFVANITTSLGVNLNLYEFVPSFIEERNRTVLGMHVANNSKSDHLYHISFIYSSLVTNLLPLVLILVFSVTLAVHMKRQASWRLEAAHHPANQNEDSAAHDQRTRRKYAQDMRVSKTVLSIAVVSCILRTLYALRSLLAVTIPGFQPMQGYGGEYRLVSRILMFASEINSSVNIIIYYTIGSKFRMTLKRLFRLKDKEM